MTSRRLASYTGGENARHAVRDAAQRRPHARLLSRGIHRRRAGRRSQRAHHAARDDSSARSGRISNCLARSAAQPLHRLAVSTLARAGFAALGFDCLTSGEKGSVVPPINPSTVARRLLAATTYLRGQPEIAGLRLGYMSTGGAIAGAMSAAAELATDLGAVVSIGAVPDLLDMHLKGVNGAGAVDCRWHSRGFRVYRYRWAVSGDARPRSRLVDQSRCVANQEVVSCIARLIGDGSGLAQADRGRSAPVQGWGTRAAANSIRQRYRNAAAPRHQHVLLSDLRPATDCRDALGA